MRRDRWRSRPTDDGSSRPERATKDPCELRGAWIIDTTAASPARYVRGFGVGALRFSDDGRSVTAAAGRLDVERATLDASDRQSDGVGCAAATRRLVFHRVADGLVASLTDARTGAVLHRFAPVQTAEQIAVSGNGQRIAVLDRDALTVYDAATLAVVSTIENSARWLFVALSPDGAKALLETVVCSAATASSSAAAACPTPDLSLWSVDDRRRLWSQREGAGERLDLFLPTEAC